MSSSILLRLRRRWLPAACLLAIPCLAAAPACADSGPMRLGGPAAPPAGFLAFCHAAPARCGAEAWQVARAEAQAPATALAEALARRLPSMKPAGAAAPAATARREQWAAIVRVNREVNRRLKPASDVADEWTLPLAEGRRTGDCEDFALEKLRALTALGVPSAALSLAVVRTPQEIDHAVLLVETAEGPKVLDNLTSEIRDWRATPYRWASRQVPGHPLEWRIIAGA